MESIIERTKRGINIFQLKVIALIAMICSHLYKVILVSDKRFVWLDLIGRISFPIFCFVLVEGFCYSKNRKAYLFRLWIFAVFSEIPFNLAFFGKILDFRMQNILFTMVIGIMVMWGMEKIGRKWSLIPLAVGMAVAWIAKVDYGYYAIVVITLFYYFRGMKTELTILQSGCHIGATALYGWKQFFAPLAMVFIWFYNGEKGKGWKYLFYVLYPLHLWILFLCKNV